MLLGLGASVLWLAASAESGERRPAASATGRVLLVPVNLAVRAVPEVEPGVEPVWRALLEYFGSEEQPAIALDRADATALWYEVMADAKRAGGEDDLYAAYGLFAQRVGAQVEFDSIVFPTLVTRSARIHGRAASWDGVRRTVEIPGQFYESIDTYRNGKIWLSRYGANGELAAASLHIAAMSPRGELRHEGTGGLVLLQEIVEPRDKSGVELTTVLRRDPFAAADQLREGIAAAFRGWPTESAAIAH